MMMPAMSGCSVKRQCDQGALTGAACAPLSLLGDVCTEMPTMQICKDGYSALCGLGSKVLECSKEPPIPSLPGMSEAKEATVMMCNMMTMAGCQSCTSQACPDPLL